MSKYKTLLFLFSVSVGYQEQEPGRLPIVPRGLLPCQYCNKLFTSNCYVQRHERIHTGEKPYNCDICGQWFSHKGNLSTHKRVHTGEKPYNCETCGKSFSQSSALKSHKLVHVTGKYGKNV